MNDTYALRSAMTDVLAWATTHVSYRIPAGDWRQIRDHIAAINGVLDQQHCRNNPVANSSLNDTLDGLGC